MAQRAQLETAYAGTTVDWAGKVLELTDLEIAAAMGVDRKTIQRWRERESVPSITHRYRMEKLN